MTASVYRPTTTRLYSMEGRDARDFLHRLTTVNVQNMDDGDFRAGFFLTPQGKIRAPFRLACVKPDSFLFEVEGGEGGAWAQEMLAAIDQFTFAEEFKLEEKKEWMNAWAFGWPEGLENRYQADGPLTYLHGSDAFGTKWTSVWGPMERVYRFIDQFVAEEDAKSLSESDFERFRIGALVPRVDQEILADVNPLELGLRGAIADNKGCYPGQEVIEKIISLGSPAKRLARIDAEKPLALGAKVLLADGKSEVGAITSASGKTGLALLRKNALEEGKALLIQNGANETAAPFGAKVGKIARYE